MMPRPALWSAFVQEAEERTSPANIPTSAWVPPGIIARVRAFPMRLPAHSDRYVDKRLPENADVRRPEFDHKTRTSWDVGVGTDGSSSALTDTFAVANCCIGPGQITCSQRVISTRAEVAPRVSQGFFPARPTKR